MSFFFPIWWPIRAAGAPLSKTVGILSKVRHFVNKHILVMLYYSLIYQFLTYDVHVWGLTSPSFLTQLFIIQKSNQNNIFL